MQDGKAITVLRPTDRDRTAGSSPTGGAVARVSRYVVESGQPRFAATNSLEKRTVRASFGRGLCPLPYSEAADACR